MIKINNKKVIKIVLNDKEVSKIYINGSYRYLKKSNLVQQYLFKTKLSNNTTQDVAYDTSNSVNNWYNLIGGYHPSTLTTSSIVNGGANLLSHIIIGFKGRSSSSGNPSASSLTSTVTSTNLTNVVDYTDALYIKNSNNFTVSNSSSSYGYGQFAISFDTQIKSVTNVCTWASSTSSSDRTLDLPSGTTLSKGTYLLYNLSRSDTSNRKVVSYPDTIPSYIRPLVGYGYIAPGWSGPDGYFVSASRASGSYANYKSSCSVLLFDVTEDEVTPSFLEKVVGTSMQSYGCSLYKIEFEDEGVQRVIVPESNIITSNQYNSTDYEVLDMYSFTNNIQIQSQGLYGCTNLTKMRYNGTMAQINALRAGGTVHLETSSTTYISIIYCNDGVIKD